MEKLPIKLNELSSIMNSLIEKIQLLDSPVFTRQQKHQFSKEMEEVVDNLRMFFHSASTADKEGNMKNFNESIERAFSQFEWNTNVAVTPYEFSKFSENGKLLISSILKLLGTKGCGILIIETYLMFCNKVLSEMREQVEIKELSTNKSHFRLLLDGFSVTANALKKYWHIAFSQNQKNSLMLCLHQICKFLPFLLKMIEIQNIDVKKYALNVLSKCLNRMLSEIHFEGSSDSNNFGQKFILQMDFCLYKLNELSNYSKDLFSFIEKANSTVTVLKPVIDEVLSMVMSIAHVTNFQDDFSAILTVSQKVLREFNELADEIKEGDASQIKLNANSLGECLCKLEHQVNNAVLKLVLEVFSGVNSPLKNILNRCREDIGKDNKASEDLNVLISDFDLEMDRIMQIGFFSIACTTSLNRILGIESCLASMESLESELIPSLTALYIDCNDKNKSNFQHLFDFWLSEITEMKNLIDSILDPAGFCGVVNIQIKNLRSAFQEETSNVSLNNLKLSLKQGIRYSRKLIRTIKISMKDDDEIDKKTEDHLNKLQLAIQECEAVLNLLEEEQDSNRAIGQAGKRYNLLVQTVDKLSSHLFLSGNADDDDEGTRCEEMEKSSDEKIFSKLEIPQKNYYKLCEPSELSVTPCNAVPEILTPYMSTGISLSKRRNILYTAPTQEEFKDKKLSESRYWEKTPISSKRSRYCKPLTLNLELENTIDLEVTTILKNISDLSNTLNKNSKGGVRGGLQKEGNKKEWRKSSRDVGCGVEKGIDDRKPVYASSGCCAKLDSEEEEKKNEEDDDEEERNFLGKKLRNNFLQTLNELSINESLLVATDSESTNIESPDRVNDIKIVEEKINFIKNRMPSSLL